MPRLPRFAYLGAFTIAIAAGRPQGAEFRLFESELAHDAATEAVAYGTVSPQSPANWKTPEDYAAGTAHFRLEILEKPGATGVMSQVCLEQGGRAAGRRACAKDFAFFDKGDYRWSQPLSEFAGAASLDWTRRPEELVLLHKDCFAKTVSSQASDWVGSPYLTLYYPMRARLTVALVSAGGTFSGWPVSIRRPWMSPALSALPVLDGPGYRADGRSLAPGPASAAAAGGNWPATGIAYTPYTRVPGRTR
jgi:hypothetical protein